MIEQPISMNPLASRWMAKLSCLGPGLLMAGAAIGVSHLVQSTRAGADFGFQLLIFVVVVNLLKYPFFEFGHRYAAATGENLLEGYKKLGSGYLLIFLVLNVLSGVIAIAGVTFVTAALLSLLTGNDYDMTQLSLICMLLCAALIGLGHYKWLDRVMKIIMFMLVVTTLLAFSAAVYHGPVKPLGFEAISPWQLSALPFLVALMGWMPAPIELSVWQSLWIQAKCKETQRSATMDEARFDFNFGYFITILLAVIFLALGALVMHGSGLSFANSGPAFAAQLVQLYTQLLGGWVWPIVAIAALCTMFSTTLTVIDAYPRSLASGLGLLTNKQSTQGHHMLWLIGMCLLALWIIHGFMNHFKQMIDLATTIAFVSGPLFAYLNFKLMGSKHMPKAYHPSKFLKIVSCLGLVFLSAMALLYVYTLIF